jgi:RimJ/RimL family protein N-acetyltransferase
VKLSPEYPVHTERLSLRPLRATDTDDLLAYRSLPEVCRYVPFEPMDESVITKRLASDWARTTIDGDGQALTLGIELPGESRLVGDVMLRVDSAIQRSGEIGWVINPEFWGNGYATEAAREILRLGFEDLGLHRVIARVHADNGPSMRVATRLRMRQEAHLINNELFKGGWGSEVDYGMLEEEWKELHGSDG